MKKVIIFISLITSIFILNNKVYAYKSYKIGDKVTYNDIDFYVIKDSGSDSDYVSLLKDTLLTKKEINDAGGVAKSSWNGNNTVSYYTSENCKYDGNIFLNEGCINDYGESDVKKIVDNWVKIIIGEENLTIDNLGYKSRLLTYDELLSDLGYSNSVWAISDWILNKDATPEFIYAGNKSYWTMSPYSDTNDTVWRIVGTDGSLGISKIAYTGSLFGVRPVINLKKNSIEKADVIIEKTSDNKAFTYKSYKIGDVVTHNDIKFYVIKDSSSENEYVTLLKLEPLTTDEVKLYGGVGTDDNHVNKYLRFNTGVPYDFDGYGGMAFYTCEECRNSGCSCTSEFPDSDVKYVVDKWSEEKFDEGDLIIDEFGYKSRLMSLEDLISLGYIKNDNNRLLRNSDSVPNWLYNNHYNQWTMSNFSEYALLIVSFDGSNQWSPPNNTFSVVRPVINLKKSVIEKEINNENENTDNSDKNDSIIITVPDTLLSNKNVLIFGIILLIVGFGFFICLKIRSKK